jgi:hypothetical protein
MSSQLMSFYSYHIRSIRNLMCVLGISLPAAFHPSSTVSNIPVCQRKPVSILYLSFRDSSVNGTQCLNIQFKIDRLRLRDDCAALRPDSVKQCRIQNKFELHVARKQKLVVALRARSDVIAT